MASDVIGVVGLGNMGSAIAQRLLDLGTEVRVFDVRPEPPAALLERGATAASSVTELAAVVDVIVAALPSLDASTEVAKEARDSNRLAVYVETSTIGPACAREVERLLEDVPVIDAPMSGGPHGILAGNVSSYVAGSLAARERIAPWFDRLCGSQTVIGERVGSAQIAKLVNNAISLSGMAVACEAIAVGVAAGLDPLALVDAVNAGTGRNSATLSKIPKSIMPGRFNFGGPIFLAEKDLEMYLELAQEAGIDNSTVDASLQAFREAITRFGGSADYTEIARIFEGAVGAEIRHRPNSADARAPRLWRSETLD